MLLPGVEISVDVVLARDLLGCRISWVIPGGRDELHMDCLGSSFFFKVLHACKVSTFKVDTSANASLRVRHFMWPNLPTQAAGWRIKSQNL